MGTATGLGDDSGVSELGKEDATHYYTLCESPSPVGEEFLHDLLTELHVDWKVHNQLWISFLGLN